MSEAAEAAARAFTAALNGQPLPLELLAPNGDQATLAKRLARLRGNYGACELEAPLSSNGKDQAVFRLRCSEGPLELTLRFEPKTGLVADVTAAQPRSYGSVCAE